MKKLNITLDEIGKEIPFGVPDNYFDQFASQMDQQIGVKHLPVSRLLRPWMYMAAMFLGIMFLGQVLFNLYQNTKAQNAENYELYVLSQVDETSLMDCYVDYSVK